MAHTETQSHRENTEEVFSVAFSSFCVLCVMLFSVVLFCVSAPLREIAVRLEIQAGRHLATPPRTHALTHSRTSVQYGEPP